MHAERDCLSERVFPELEERLRKRFQYLEPVDLRLGIEMTGVDASSRELLILKVCLDEIKRSRPFLIGLIGDRFGWRPPSKFVRTALKEAGLQTDLSGASVMAIEVEFGLGTFPAPRRGVVQFGCIRKLRRCLTFSENLTAVGTSHIKPRATILFLY